VVSIVYEHDGRGKYKVSIDGMVVAEGRFEEVKGVVSRTLESSRKSKLG
jgi:hypothetical protein